MFALGDDRYAARLIRSGEADIAVCGGTEAAIHRITLGSFAAARALSTGFNDRPQEASRPFDRDRDGFVMAEGAGLLVIESLEPALAQGLTECTIPDKPRSRLQNYRLAAQGRAARGATRKNDE